MTVPEGTHLDVGAYVLGLLEPRERAEFEAHLEGCARCADEAAELSGLEPLLAEFAAATAPAGGSREAGSTDDADPLPRPGPELLDRLVGRVTAARRTARTRRLFLVAAAVAVLIGGPLLGAAVSGGGTAVADHHPSSPASWLMDSGEQHSATDARTGAVATVSLEDKKWGTHVALRLGNVQGPLRCSLIAVTRSGAEQAVTGWAVPAPGYGVPGAADPLVTHGGVGYPATEIDHFEVRTDDGRELVAIPVRPA
ncbi:anti-sigma factor family protein [Kitasatospora sp. NPDC058218]|uniref:anti-sigma factor family protein n=1 Tax=Kitasatospora sp. NPDC058218 TaxID=3346385 RepID=UPI0036D93BA5